MKFKRRLIYLLIIGLFLVGGPVVAIGEQSGPSESELLSAAWMYSVNKDYHNAARAYEKILALDPQTRNETVYRELGMIYENKLYQFHKAVNLYQNYLAVNPGGRFSQQFWTKLQYLLNLQPDWDILREYRQICDTYHHRETCENIEMMENLLAKNPNSKLVPEIYNWLSWEYNTLWDLKRARYYVEKYIETFAEHERPVREQINAYEHYALILMEMHLYKKALNVLDQMHEMQPEAFTNYGKKVQTVTKERILWYGVVISYTYIGLLCIMLMVLKPWRVQDFKIQWGRMIKGALTLIIFTLVPMWIVRKNGYGIFYSFPTLTFAGTLMLFLINLLSPLSRIYNKKVFYLLIFFLIFTGLYVSFYKWDNLCIFYTRPGY